MGPVIGPDGNRCGFARIYCKAWDCTYCGPRKATRLCRHIERAAKEHGLSRFLTLTLDPKKLDPTVDQVAFIREVWRKFRVYLAREYGQPVQFINVLECHKSGIPHLHILLDRFIRQQWISQCWSKLGGGRVVYIEKVNNLENVSWYLGKYLTKDVLLSARKGMRRYSTSRGIRLFPKGEDLGWKQAPAPIEELLAVAGDAATDIRLDSRGAVKSFTSDKPIMRLKGIWRPLVAVQPFKYVDPWEHAESMDLEDILALCLAMKDEQEALS
jgi:hypothetical protein